MDKKRLDAVRRLVARLVAVPDLTGEALDIAHRLNRHLALPRDRKSTRLNSSHLKLSRMPSSA